MTDMLHNHEAEQWVLGSILLDSEALLAASDILQPQDFHLERHRLIYSSALDCYQLLGAIDLITIHERLATKGMIEQAGGISYLSRLADIPTAANVRHHAKIVKDKAILRRVQQWTHTVNTQLNQGIDDVHGFFGSLEQGIIELQQTVRETRSPEISDIISSLKTRWQREQDGIKDHIDTDSKLYSIIPRYVPGHLWIVGGYTSVGKSTFVAQQIVDVCEKDARCLVFSIEDSREDKAMKLLSNIADISQIRLMTGNLDNVEHTVNAAVMQLRDWDIRIYDDIYTINEIRLKVKKHKLHSGLDIVFLDYIQNIQGEGSLYERLSDAIVKLQAMAKELQVTIIVVSQVSNEAMRSNSEIIGLKGAGELAAAADIVLWLKRQKGDGRERHLDCEVRKNRPFGFTGIKNLMFSEKWSRIIKRGEK